MSNFMERPGTDIVGRGAGGSLPTTSAQRRCNSRHMRARAYAWCCLKSRGKCVWKGFEPTTVEEIVQKEELLPLQSLTENTAVSSLKG